MTLVKSPFLERTGFSLFSEGKLPAVGQFQMTNLDISTQLMSGENVGDIPKLQKCRTGNMTQG